MPLDRHERGVDVFCLDVGQGDLSLVLPPLGEGGAIIFDCRDAEVLLKTLGQYRIDHVGAFVISHLDRDHIAGVGEFLARFEGRIDVIYLPVDREIGPNDPGREIARMTVGRVREGEEDAAGRGRWRVVDAKADPRPVAAANDGWWSVHVVAPRYSDLTLVPALTDDWEHDANRHSAVLRVRVGDRCVLIGGDAPLATWARLPESERSAKVFRIPHHGGRLVGSDDDIPDGWSVERLYEVVGADVAVVSVGTCNDLRWGHPRPEWVYPISGGSCRMMCTQVTPRCQPDVRDPARAQSHRAGVIRRGTLVEPPWKHYRDAIAVRRRPSDEVPCAGTVVVRMTAEGVEVLPEVIAHEASVLRWDHPLCLPWPVTDPLSR